MLFLIDKISNTDPAVNLALEEYLLRSLDINHDYFLPYVNSPCVIIGRHQNVFEEVNYPLLRKQGLPVFRRISGGGTVYHDPGNLNFSFITQYQKFKFNNYRLFNAPILEALQSLGIPAEDRDIDARAQRQEEVGPDRPLVADVAAELGDAESAWVLMTYLAPVVPFTATTAAGFLGVPLDRWADLDEPMLDVAINAFLPLLTRVDPHSIEAMIEHSKEHLQASTPARPPLQLAPEIEIADFLKVDLRIAKIVGAKAVPEADKLVQLTLDIGGETAATCLPVSSPPMSPPTWSAVSR